MLKKNIYHLITLRYLKSRKVLLISCLITIIITSVFFTSILTVATSIQKTQQLQYFESLGTDHLWFMDLPEKDLKAILNHNNVASGSYELYLGEPTNQELDALSLSPVLQYNTQENLIERYALSFLEGNPPQGYYEIATSTQVLDTLGIPRKIGVEVPIIYKNHETGATVSETFVLSGYYESTVLLYGIERISVSKAYKDKNFINPKGEASVSLIRSSRLKKQGDAILASIESTEGFVENNPSYNSLSSENVSVSVLVAITFLILFVLYTGYTLISNIFTICIRYDVELYSQLKCLGATQIQIKKLLRLQLLYLSMVGIPLGLLVGYLLNNVFLSSIASTLNGAVIDTNMFVYAGTALFVFLCLCISTRVPSQFCKRISPVLLLSSPQTQKRKVPYRKKGKLRISLWKLAHIQTLSHKKELLKVIVSLSFMPIMLLGVATFIKSFDSEKFIDTYFASDFVVAKNTYFTGGSIDVSYLNSSVVSNLEANIPVTQSSPVYFTEGSMRYYSNTTEYDTHTNFSGEYIQSNSNVFTAHYYDTEYEVDLYSMGDFLLESYEVIDGNLDLKKFNQGGYLIEIEPHGSTPSILQTNKEMAPVNLYYADNFVDSYQVMATVKSRAATENRLFFGSYMKKFIMPINTYKAIPQKSSADNYILSYTFNVSTDDYDASEAYLQNLTESNPQLGFESVKISLETLKQDHNMYTIAGFFLASLFGFIGLVNLFATTTVSIYSRKDQFKNLRKIGMSKKQLHTMLRHESTIYLIGTIISFVCLGALFVGILLRTIIVEGGLSTFTVDAFPSLIVLGLYALCAVVCNTCVLSSIFKQDRARD